MAAPNPKPPEVAPNAGGLANPCPAAAPPAGAPKLSGALAPSENDDWDVCGAVDVVDWVNTCSYQL